MGMIHRCFPPVGKSPTFRWGEFPPLPYVSPDLTEIAVDALASIISRLSDLITPAQTALRPQPRSPASRSNGHHSAVGSRPRAGGASGAQPATETSNRSPESVRS